MGFWGIMLETECSLAITADKLGKILVAALLAFLHSVLP
jgi:hypothetical protein